LTNLDTGQEWTLSGSELTDHGLSVDLASRPDSALIVYRKE
jgi:hypothetical protein